MEVWKQSQEGITFGYLILENFDTAIRVLLIILKLNYLNSDWWYFILY